MGCRHCFVVDLVEESVGEGGSGSSSRVHEHDSYQLVSQQNVAIQVFWSRCQPRVTLSARDLHHGKQQVSPFYPDLSRLPYWSSCCHEEKHIWGAPPRGQTTGLPVLSWFISSSNIRFWLSREKRGRDACSEQTTVGRSWFSSRQTTSFSVLSCLTVSSRKERVSISWERGAPLWGANNKQVSPFHHDLGLLWLFFTCIFFLFFATSLQNTLQNWNG